MEHNQLIVVPSLLFVLTYVPQTIKLFLFVLIVSQTIKVEILRRQSVGYSIVAILNDLEVPWNRNGL